MSFLSAKSLSVLALGIIFSMFIYHPAYAADVTEVVSDTNLYNTIKQEVEHGTLCANYDDSTHEVTVSESCRNSVTYFAAHNHIVDISSLPILFPKLETLLLYENNIQNITHLSSLTNLKKLELYKNEITEIPNSFSNLTNLTILDLRFNQISDISPLANLRNLENLQLEENQISDLLPLTNLTKLTHLDLEHNKISDLSPISNLTNLTFLDLDYNNISDLSPLDGFADLNYSALVQSATLEYNKKSFTSPSILPYHKKIVQELGLNIKECPNEPSDETEVCLTIIGASLSEDYENIDIDDTTKTVSIKITVRNKTFTNEILSLTFEPNMTEDDNIDAPDTLDSLVLYLPVAIIFTISNLILTKKLSRR